MLDVIGVGDTDVDLTIRIDHIPSRDEKVRGTLISKAAGGVIGNFCCVAAHIGLHVGVASVVGDDEYGKIAIEDYKRFSVDLKGLTVKKGESTYFCLILIDNSGEKALTLVETNLVVPTPEDIDVEYLRQAKFVHMTSLSYKLAAHVAHLGSLRNTKLSIDIEGHQDITGIENWESILRRMSIVFINERGFHALLGGGDLNENAQVLLRMGPEIVVVTRGDKGCRIFMSEERFDIQAFRVPVADTTGAGDCFNAIFLAGQIRGDSVHDSALRATAGAAIAIQTPGSHAGLPSFAEIEAFIVSHPRK